MAMMINWITIISKTTKGTREGSMCDENKLLQQQKLVARRSRGRRFLVQGSSILIVPTSIP